MLSEQQILKLIRKITPHSKKYLFDDAAVIEKNLVVTTDTLIENTHFTLKTYTPEEIGWKAMAVNLSDIAAMGAKPLYALISLSLPKKFIRAGLKPAQRSNAKPGDIVFATGTFGSPAKKPIPQIEIGQKIVRACFKHAPALMDSSDGLADCLIQISEQSKVKIIVEEGKIPKGRNPLNLALYAGEDYQLVGTVSRPDWENLKKIKGIKIIGKVAKGKGAFVKQKNNKLVRLDMKNTFKHFS